MKTRFSTIDVTAAVNDLKALEGNRIVNVYDVNHKTYIMKLSCGPEKSLILFESGIRIHRSYHDCEKAPFPSNFSVKLRKHLNNRRLTKVRQISMDRIVDMQIDEGERSVHVIVELYDKGNIVLTDSNYTILNVLRPRTDKDKDVKFAVNQIYPIAPEKDFPELPTAEQLAELLNTCDQKSPLKRSIVVPGLFTGALIEHALLVCGQDPNAQVSSIEDKNECAVVIVKALNLAVEIASEIKNRRSAGYVPYETQKRMDNTEVEILLEYHPYLYHQLEKGTYRVFGTFCEAVDTYYATLESQKQQQNALKVEKEAIKKLENVKKDQERRILELEYSREEKMVMADLIIHNKAIVDAAIQVICSALARKTSWEDVERMHQDAVEKGDAVASAITKLDLQNNRIIMRLKEEYEDIPPKDVPISIDTNAFGNACKFYHGMKAAAEKALRTEVAAKKAIRNAEDKATTTIKKVNINVSSVKTRKEMWFEKFIWFISSEKYVVLTGRDATQNELLVKKYLRPEDIYVHADAHGAASVVIRNKPGGGEIPPKTLTEAAQMATCITKAWGSHIASSAWWVYASQVSKAAQPGEYVTKGSFIIRGKKNYLPSCPLVLGFGILFRVDEISAEKHRKQSQEQAQNLSEMEPEEYTAQAPTNDNDESTLEEYTANPPTNDNGEGDLDGEEEYPDISLDVPTVRLQVEEENPDEYSVIEFANKTRAKKANVPKKELETKEYLEKKAEEERKAAAAKKVGKRQKHKLEKIRKKYKDQDEEEREMRLTLLGCRGKQKSDDARGVNGKEVGSDKHPSTNNKGEAKGARQRLQKPELEDTRSTDKENAPDLEVCEKNHNGSDKNGDGIHETTKIEDGVINGESAQENLISGHSKDEVQNEPNTAGTAAEQQPSSQAKNEVAVDDAEGSKGAENDDEEEDLKTTSEGTEALVSQLISNPEPDDVLLYAVTMVGPYQVFQNFKYKVKLTPGSSKKGKAGKLAIDLFLRMKNNESLERELIRALTSSDKSWMNIPTGCRVSAPMLHAKK